MPITHHPPDDTVLRYATGTLPEAPAIVVATHLSFCPACRERMETFEMLGGSMLESAAPEKLSPDALSKTLSRLNGENGNGRGSGGGHAGSQAQAEAESADMHAGTPAQTSRKLSEAGRVDTAMPADSVSRGSRSSVGQPELPESANWPWPLPHYDIPRWRFMAPGVKWTTVSLSGAGAETTGQLLLLRGAPGTRLPSHGHSGTEYTCVLTGSFSDSTGTFTAGDLIEANEDLDHQPIVRPDAECVCLIAIEGHLRLHGLARLLQPFFGL